MWFTTPEIRTPPYNYTFFCPKGVQIREVLLCYNTCYDVRSTCCKLIVFHCILRIVEMYSRRLQGEGVCMCTIKLYTVCIYISLTVCCVPPPLAVQERLTKEIADAVLRAINPTGVAVIVEATYVRPKE